MWVCNLCGSEFEEPTVKHYREDMNGEGAWQDFYEDRCPYCGSEEVEEMPIPTDDDENDLFAMGGTA